MDNLYNASISYRPTTDTFKLDEFNETINVMTYSPLNYEWYKEYWYPVLQDHFHGNTQVVMPFIQSKETYDKAFKIAKELLKKRIIASRKLSELMETVYLISQWL